MSNIRQIMIGIFVMGIFINIAGFLFVTMTLKPSELKGKKGVTGPKGAPGPKGDIGDAGPATAARGLPGAKGPKGLKGLPCWEENSPNCGV